MPMVEQLRPLQLPRHRPKQLERVGPRLQMLLAWGLLLLVAFLKLLLRRQEAATQAALQGLQHIQGQQCQRGR